MIAAPGSSHTCILRKAEMLSTPAFVRVSDMKMSPLLSRIATQYVTSNPSGPAPYCWTWTLTKSALSPAP